jgi:glycerol-1-phosphate dehydrogenase [NAD(P)+]
MRTRIRAVTLGASRMITTLAAAGAPIGPADLAWPHRLFDDALLHAREIRNRYTFLDFAADLA